jgi:hypothetical protein
LGDRGHYEFSNHHLLEALLSDLSYPAGHDRSSFKFITPFASDRKKWKELTGINLSDGREYRIDMVHRDQQNRVVPETFRSVLRLYLRRSESKSLAPDGTRCVADTRGLLKRASITAAQIIPVGKETDRHWEQGDDMSILDFKVMEYREPGKLVIASASDREKLSRLPKRELMRKTGLSQKAVYAVLEGKPVRQKTLAIFKRVLGQNAVASQVAEKAFIGNPTMPAKCSNRPSLLTLSSMGSTLSHINQLERSS